LHGIPGSAIALSRKNIAKITVYKACSRPGRVTLRHLVTLELENFLSWYRKDQ
jgi:hypothetical protein